LAGAKTCLLRQTEDNSAVRTFFIRNVEAWAYLEIFLVSAVAAILGIRVFLELTGYPRLGGARLHIAHMLWGGLLMLVAIVLLLGFLSKSSHRLASVIGGFGFGTFIDEIGKFVTRDNDYFFQPAVALMYITFIATYLAIHTIHTGREYSRQEYLINALREMEEVVLHDLDEEDKKRALLYLSQSDPAHPLVPSLERIVSATALAPRAKPGPFSLVKQRLQQMYRRFAALPLFASAVILFFVIKLALTALYTISLVFFWGFRWEPGAFSRLVARVAERAQDLSFVDAAQLLSSVAAGAFILAGVLYIRTARLKAFQMFERSVLVSIFVTQVFSFYKEQFAALLGLAVNILILMAIRFIQEQERLAAAGAPVRPMERLEEAEA
jgi:hypothetical protein